MDYAQHLVGPDLGTPTIGQFCARAVILLAMATLHSNLLALFIKGRSVVLVRDGAPDVQAMRRYDVSDADLSEGLRMGQLERVEDAALVTFERGGKISVIPRNTKATAR